MNRTSKGFTLVELLISLALVLILVLGINFVFATTTKSIGAGQALSTAARDNRSLQGLFYNDFVNYGSRSPLLIIESNVVGAFASKQDELGDRGDVRTIDLDANNAEGETGVPGEVISLVDMNTRNHRLDKISFIASGPTFYRQTGNDGTFVDTATTSSEAYISYGHLRLYDGQGAINDDGPPPGSSGSYPFPGQANTAADPNPDNLYARDFVLGRSQILLLTAIPANTEHIAPTSATDLQPLAVNSASSVADFTVQESRFDLAATSAITFAERIRGNASWWEPLSYRFICNPFANNPARTAAEPKLTSQLMAQASPYLLAGCTQFAVEFAGDFLKQDPATGAVLGWYGSADVDNRRDGQVDFIPVYEGATMTRRVRWYGFPRNSDSADDVGGVAFVKGAGVESLPGTSSRYRDVVPLRDILTANAAVAAVGIGPYVTFERASTNTLTPAPPAAKANYAGTGLLGVVAGEKYYAAWGPDDSVRPKMIRLIISADDPSGRMVDAQTFEYVIELP